MKYFAFFLVVCISHTLNAQDKSYWNEFFGANGGIRAGTSIYKNFSGVEQASPFSYYISGNANVKLGTINLPFSVTYRDHNYSYSQPYIHMGISPNYKNVTLHLGYRNMNFSPYTLSGITFLGGGFEANPGKMRMAGMYGKFQNPYAQRDTIVQGAELIPTYSRKGYAGKLGYGTDRNHVDLIYFRAYDDVSSVDVEARPTQESLRPKDNVGIGLNAKFRLAKRLVFSVNSATSIFTNDENFDKITLDEKWEKRLNSFFNLNGSTRVSYAGDAALHMNFMKYRAGIKYRRIAPFFNSLGSYFLQNDTEEYTFQLSGAIIKSLRFSSSVGLQRNNLDGRRSTKMNRFILSTNVRYSPKGPFNLSATYTNYDISNKPVIIEQNDSLQLVRVMRQLRLSPSYRIKGKEMQHNIGLTLTTRSVTSTFMNVDRPSGNDYLALRYSTTYKPWDATLGSTVSYNNYESMGRDRGRIGININARKKLLDKKLNAGVTFGVFENTIDKKREGSTFRSTLNMSYSIKKQQRINFSFGYTKRQSVINDGLSNLRARLDYALTL